MLRAKEILQSTFVQLKSTVARHVLSFVLILIGVVVVVQFWTHTTQPSLRASYTDRILDMGLNPVYPPREEFQVGDVFLRSLDWQEPHDSSKSFWVWLGTIPSVQEAADKYLASRINYSPSAFDPSVEDTSGPIREPEHIRRTLPIVAFPAISAKIGNTGGLGDTGFLRSLGIALSEAETILLDLGDTRMYGIPEGAPLNLSLLGAEFEDGVCRSVPSSLNRARALAKSSMGINAELACSESRYCDFAVITRTYLTKSLNYTYTSSKVSSVQAAVRELQSDADKRPLPLPGNLSLNLSVDDSSSEEFIKSLSELVNTKNNTETISSFQISGINGNTVSFSKAFSSPVTVAYEAFNYSVDRILRNCDLPRDSFLRPNFSDNRSFFERILDRLRGDDVMEEPIVLEENGPVVIELPESVEPLDIHDAPKASDPETAPTPPPDARE